MESDENSFVPLSLMSMLSLNSCSEPAMCKQTTTKTKTKQKREDFLTVFLSYGKNPVTNSCLRHFTSQRSNDAVLKITASLLTYHNVNHEYEDFDSGFWIFLFLFVVFL